MSLPTNNLCKPDNMKLLSISGKIASRFEVSIECHRHSRRYND